MIAQDQQHAQVGLAAKQAQCGANAGEQQGLSMIGHCKRINSTGSERRGTSYSAFYGRLHTYQR